MGTGLGKFDTDWLTGQIIGGAIDIHRYFGPGMLEHTYEVCLEAALRKRGLQVVNVDALAAGGWKRVLRRR
jgi:GxxExxY protein